MRKKIYKGKYISLVEKTSQFWFSKPKTEIGTVSYTSYYYVLAKSEREAVGKFEDLKDFEETLPFDCVYENYKIKEQHIETEELTKSVSLNTLKSHMPAEDFLKYCKQEFYDPEELLFGEGG